MEPAFISADVHSLAPDQRHAAELLVGRSLRSDQMVVMMVLDPAKVPSAEDKELARGRLESLFQKIDERATSTEDASAADEVIDAAISAVRAQSR